MTLERGEKSGASGCGVGYPLMVPPYFLSQIVLRVVVLKYETSPSYIPSPHLSVPY